MTLQSVYTIVVGLMLVAGLASIIYTLPKVTAYRKPIYWLALFMNLGLLFAFTMAALRQFSQPIVSSAVILVVLEVSLFLVALELILVPYVDRLEAKHLHRPLNGEKD